MTPKEILFILGLVSYGAISSGCRPQVTGQDDASSGEEGSATSEDTSTSTPTTGGEVGDCSIPFNDGAPVCGSVAGSSLCYSVSSLQSDGITFVAIGDVVDGTLPEVVFIEQII